MEMTAIRRCTAAAVAAVALASLAACGDDGADPPDASQSEQTDQPEQTDQGDPTEPASDEDGSTEGSDGDSDGATGGEFSGDVCALGAAAITASFELNGNDPATPSPADPYALFDGAGCVWEGSFAEELHVDVSHFDDYVPITDSLVAPLEPQPVPELGPESWSTGGTMADLTWRRDGVSVYLHNASSRETAIELALAIDADLQAAGA